LKIDNATYKSLDFFARQAVEGFITGLHKSPFHGFSVEFAEHRIYNPGDNTRNIDWKLFARTDNLFVKRFEEETNLRAHLILDTSGSMFYPDKGETKFGFAIKAVAVLSLLLKKQRDAFALTTFTDKIEWQTPVRSSDSHYYEIIGRLESLLQEPPQKKQTDLANMLHLIAEKIHRRSLVVLFTDMFDSNVNLETLFEALNHLKFKKHEIILFHTVAGKQEIEFDFASGPHKFIDPETGEEFKVNTDEVKEAYRKNIANFYSLLKDKCLQYKIDMVEADINKGFEQVILPFLIKRQRLY
jgi:uncharacterized protein (DUF58 family)